MPTKIRLQRHGRSKRPFYFIVVADSRAKRDGKFISKLGVYNPTTVPATIELDNDMALQWLQKGAQPTNTCRAILSYKGVMYKKHLMRGVAKGAMSLEEAEAKYEQYLQSKDNKISSKIEDLARKQEEARKAKFDAETAKRNAKVAAMAPPEPVAEAQENVAEQPEAEVATESSPESSSEETAPVAE